VPKKLFVLLSLLLAAFALAADERRPLELKLANGSFRPAEGKAAPPTWFREHAVGASADGKLYRVAVTESALTPEQRRQLIDAGAELLGYLPDHGYRLRLRPGSEAAVRGLPFVAWLGDLPAHLKVTPQLSEHALHPPTVARLRVVLSPGEPEARVQRALAGLMSSASPSGKEGAWRIEAVVPAARLRGVLSRLASFPEVEAVESVRPVRLLNQDGVWVHQSFVGPSPQETPVFDQGIFGCGQVVSVADTAQDHDNCYFRDSVNGPPPVSTCFSPPCPAATPDMSQRKDVLYYNWSLSPTGEEDTCPTTVFLGSGHGTHTSGSAVGDTAPYADCASFTSPGRNGGDGQAPGAKLVMLELGDDVAFLNNLGGTIWNIVDVAYQSGSRIHSFSLGGVCYDALGACVPGCTLPYDSLARDADVAMWTYPDLLVINGAGNGGNYCGPPHSVVTPALAKNLIAVGSVGHGGDADTVPSTSSPGPVFDGRLKPTLAAQGESVASAASDANPNTDNCGICTLSGSSMSSPTVAGLAALVREYYTEGFYAAGARSPAQGFTPTGALIKATLIDSAVALGAGAPAPDFNSGFGRVKLDETLAFAGDPFELRVVDHRDGVVTGSVVTRAYDVTGGEPFRATLVWTDYPADLNAAVARVNELQLEVIDPGGNVWHQTLDGNGLPAATTNPGDPHDAVNVEERLVFENPTAGRWVVRVVGVDVPWGPQPFALVVRGALSDCPAPSPPGAPTLSTPADHQVQVSWPSVPGAAAYNVYRSDGSCPGGSWIQVASGVTGTSFVDTTVSGGVSYAYHVAAAADVEAHCESPPSSCQSIVPTGDCFLSPDFQGLSSASSDGSSTCSISLDWDPATPRCGAQVRYNVFRDTTAGFTPSGSNLVATCLSGTGYTDTSDLVYDNDYYYVVRAEDLTTGHGGSCGGGNEEQNLVEIRERPDGPAAFGTWSDDAGDTRPAAFQLQSSWVQVLAGGVGDSNAYRATSSAGLCSDLVSPVLTLAGPAEAPMLSFSTWYDFDYDDGTVLALQGSLGQVEISVGPDFTTWDRVELIGDYPTQTTLTLNECPTTQIPRNYFANRLLTYTGFSASLVNWAGNDVKIRFHLSGDLWWPNGEWWIDDVQVTQSLVPGPCVTGSRDGAPPPIPDGGSVPGQPLLATRNGSSVDLSWDTTTCPPAEVNVYSGDIGDYTTFTDGSCGLAPTGSATLAIPDDTWFLVVATDGASTDGSWSRNATGTELSYTGASTVCPAMTDHQPAGTCP
jgi:hypothetical protein